MQQKITVVLQINGKTKGRFDMDAADASDDANVKKYAQLSDIGIKHLKGKEPTRVIVAPNAKLINFVVNIPRKKKPITK